MVTSGDVLEHPVTREKIIIRKTARDTGGELFQADLYLQPGAFVAAEHIHPLQEERFEIIAGTLRGRVAGREFASGPGESVVVPKGAPHVWWNAGDQELHCLVDLRPALRIESFFETFFGLAQDGKVSPKIVLARPPRLVQTLLFGALAPLGRLLGYTGTHTRMSGRRRLDRGASAPV